MTPLAQRAARVVLLSAVGPVLEKLPTWIAQPRARGAGSPPPRLALTAVLSLAWLFSAPAAAQDIPDTSVEAIRAYADGAEAYLRQDYPEAMTHFARAHELDPTFFTPVFMQFVVAGNIGSSAAAVADSLEAVLQLNRDRMSGYYQGMFDAISLRRRAFFAASADVLRRTLERYPGTKAAYNYAYYDWVANPEEALRALNQLDPDREPIRGWLPYWTVRNDALHTIGDLQGALQNARDAQQRHPDMVLPVVWESYAQAALGNVDEVEAALDRAARLPGAVPGLGLRNAGQELMAHGHEREGRALIERALTWFDEEDTRTTNGARSQRAFTLYLLGRHAEARDAYRSLVDAAPDNAGYRVSLGITSALAGDRALAEEVLAGVRRAEIGSNWSLRAGYELLLSAALGNLEDARRALVAFRIRPLWVHQDPTLRRVLGSDPEFRRFLTAGS